MALVLDGDNGIVGVLVTNADGDVIIDTNTFFVDADNNRVGIGETNPAEKLEVSGNIKLDTGATQYIDFKSGTSGAKNYRIYNGIGWNPDALLVYNHTDDSTILTIEPGKLGINRGASSLTQAFEVNGGAWISGNVGIGTDDPSSPLHVRKAGNPNGGNRDTVETVLTLDATGYYPYGGYGVGIDFKGEDYGNTAIREYAKIEAVMVGHSNQTAAGDSAFTSALTFATNSGGASSTLATEKMRIDDSGNVGIGTQSPYKKLTLSSAFGGSAEDLLDLQSSNAGGGTAPKIRFGTWANNSNTIGRMGFIDNPNYGGDFIVETNSSGSATDTTTEKFRVDKDGNTTVVGTVRSHKGTIQTIVNQPTHYVSINPVNTWAEASSLFRVSITPKYSSGTTILGSFSIPINPQGASNILMAMNPWYSTDGGTTKTLLNQGGPAGSRVSGSHSWFRSSNGYDLNDMQNHIIKFGFVHTSTATLTWGFYFRSEGGNTTYFCHSQGNSATWGWTAPCYMELREVDY